VTTYGRIYSVPLARTAVTVAVDLVEIVAAATHIVIVHAIEVSQSTDVKDAEEEMLQLAFKTGATTSGSGGTASIVAVPRLIGDAASGLTIEVFNTTKATAGTIVTHNVWDWNVRVPFEKIFTPETRLIISPSTRATLELVAAPADSITIGGQLLIEVIG
jgi:hypothetical protein